MSRLWPLYAVAAAAAVVVLAFPPPGLPSPRRRGVAPSPLAAARAPPPQWPWMSAADVADFERDFAASEEAAARQAAASSDPAIPPASAAASAPGPAAVAAPVPRHLLSLAAAPPRSWVVDGRDRRPSAPFVTGDGFRAAADMRCEPPDDECAGVDAEGWAAARPGAAAVIFVKQDHVAAFAARALPRLRAARVRFVLVTHNSDAPAPASEAEARLLDEEPLLLAWFAQNPARAHARLRALPIGLENRYNPFGRNPGALLRGRAAAARAAPRRLVLAAFSAATNPSVRAPLAAAAAAAFGANVTVAAEPGQDSWYAAVADHRLVLCPAGHGLDTHRTWETLYLGRVPAVESSALDALFEDLGLPALVLADWGLVGERGGVGEIARRLAAVEARVASGEVGGAGLRLATHVCRIFSAASRADELAGCSGAHASAPPGLRRD